MKNSLLLTILILTSLDVIGQNTIEIKCRVISKNKTYLPGTHILLLNTTTGTVTNACGQFLIDIPKDRQGHLVLSMLSEPVYFDLSKLKNEDLDKEIILRVIPFDHENRIKNKRQYDIKYNCRQSEKTLTFKLTRDNSRRPKIMTIDRQ